MDSKKAEEVLRTLAHLLFAAAYFLAAYLGWKTAVWALYGTAVGHVLSTINFQRLKGVIRGF